MGDKSVTNDELLAELLASIGDDARPKAEDGWRSFQTILASAENYSADQLRVRLERGVKLGTMERTNWGKEVYYRTVRKDQS